MTPPEVHLVAAARPNLPKLAALWHALAGRPGMCLPVLVHTGQHADPAMFGDHLADLGLPLPDVSLGVAAGGGHAALTGRTMMALAELWTARRPTVVVVAGDVDGTLAAALSARKLAIPVAHLEAGLRCGDLDMPEEINRRAVDAISTALWAPDEGTAARLVAEGHPPETVRAVGNAMIDSLLRALPAARARPLPAGLAAGGYGVVTLHRPANVDDRAALSALLEAVARAARRTGLVWPLHPRTARRLSEFGLAVPEGVMVLPPLGYRDFLGLMAHARLVATDSGGVQEEAWALDLPCLTLRPSTERPVTLEAGTNRLVTPAGLEGAVAAVLAGDWPRARPIPLWDGRAGARMADHLSEMLDAPGPGTGPRRGGETGTMTA
ncbi:non-hydrolyzing UDP-N-acetylglucosamine 2-epimerase [Muricoccus radiodurans]|uniref:non-hydrolyzing UDP-N-acetylglucosamine 2-epimerase n=1 Tax=Muricoccus radiodurans TaxID=2231721 RepID=UPI003CE9A288